MSEEYVVLEGKAKYIDEHIELEIFNPYNFIIRIRQYLGFLSFIKDVYHNEKKLNCKETSNSFSKREIQDSDYKLEIKPKYSKTLLIPLSGDENQCLYYDLEYNGKYKIILNDKFNYCLGRYSKNDKIGLLKVNEIIISLENLKDYKEEIKEDLKEDLNKLEIKKSSKKSFFVSMSGDSDIDILL